MRVPLFIIIKHYPQICPQSRTAEYSSRFSTVIDANILKKKFLQEGQYSVKEGNNN
jgi:hypothetical protein